MIEFFAEGVVLPEGLGERLSPIIQQACDDHKMFIEYLNIVLVSDKRLLEINRDFLQHDYYTDIITFNYSDDPLSEIEGELYISTERVEENARELNVDFQDELNRVVLHGVLHLCGYSDKQITEKKSMQLAEDKYVNKIVSRET